MVSYLGINSSPSTHDPAACIVDATGEVLAFMEEERLSRHKHAVGERPANAVVECIESSGIELSELAAIGFGWNRRGLFPGIPHADESSRLFVEEVADELTRRRGRAVEFQWVPHHLAHAYCAFLASPYDSALVLVADGQGESTSWSAYLGNRESNTMELLDEASLSRSIGFLYDAACRKVGYSHLEAGKLMGLAAYTSPQSLQGRNLMDLRDSSPFPDPPFVLGRRAPYAEILHAWRYVLGEGRDVAEPTPDWNASDRPDCVQIAADAQATVEACLVHAVGVLRARHGHLPLCFAGGVALNSRANALLPRPVYVPPVPHDAGVALGAAWSLSGRKSADALSPFLGTHATTAIRARDGIKAHPFDPDTAVAELLTGAIYGIVHARSEIGPRGLGHRSILANAFDAEMHLRLNVKKNREPWRPLAPLMLPSCRDQWLSASPQTDPGLARYMAAAPAASVWAHTTAPAAVHADGTARLQVLGPDEADTPAGGILSGLAAAGLAPVVLNTSLNRRGEPIVQTVDEGLDCLDDGLIDVLVADDLCFRRSWT